MQRRFGFSLLLVIVALACFLGATESDWRNACQKRLAHSDTTFNESGRSFADEQERSDALFRTIRTHHFVFTGLWYAALINLVGAGFLLLTCRWWVGAKTASPPEPTADPVAPAARWFWPAILVLLVLALIIRMPRMELSFYNDESYNFTRYIHGQFKEDRKSGELTFRPVTWQQTVWDNRGGNNGVLYSTLARLCYDTWAKASGAVVHQLGEWPLRIPALIPGLLSLLAVAWLARDLAGPVAGLVAVGLGAIHPWHVRYCTEARPYGLVLLFAALTLVFLIRALRDDRWRWWFGFLLCQFLTLYAFAGALYFALGINAAAFLFLFARWIRKDTSGGSSLGRFLAANTFSAMLYIQLMAPCLPQMHFFISRAQSFKGGISIRGVGDTLAYLTSGQPAFDADPSNPVSPALEKIFVTMPWLVFPAVLAGLVLFVAALHTLWKKNDRAWQVAFAGGSLAFCIAIAAANLSDSILHRWYLIYLLPLVLVALGSGATVLFAKLRFGRIIAPLAVCAVAALMLPPLQSYLQRSKEPLKEVIQRVYEGETYPFSQKADRILLGSFFSEATYHPRVRNANSKEAIQELIEEATSDERELWIEFSRRPLALLHAPQAVRFLEDSGQFDPPEIFYGLEEEQFSHFLFRYSGDRQAPSD